MLSRTLPQTTKPPESAPGRGADAGGALAAGAFGAFGAFGAGDTGVCAGARPVTRVRSAQARSVERRNITDSDVDTGPSARREGRGVAPGVDTVGRTYIERTAAK